MSSETYNSQLIPNIGREPLPAYRGSGRYFFVSYAHKDSDLVFPEIKRFQDMGYNVWYDEGIAPANEWLNNILNHLEGTDLFIIFITQNSADSENVRKEFRYAIDEKKPILPIYLEDFDKIIMDKEWKYELRGIQGILKTTLNEEEYVFKFTESFKEFGFEIFNFSNDFVTKSITESLLNSDIKLKNIKKSVDNFFNNFLINDNKNYGAFISSLKLSINPFLENPGTYAAEEIYSNFISLYEMMLPVNKSNFSVSDEKNTIRNLLNILQKYDKNISRENFIHSVNVFLVGLAVYYENEKYRTAYNNYLEKTMDKSSFYNSYHEEFFIRWGIASLFHDSLFSIESSEKRVKDSFYKELRELLNRDENYLIAGISEFNIISKLLPNFADGYIRQFNEIDSLDFYKPTDILAHKISLDFGLTINQLNQLVNNFNYFINFMYENNFDEHAFLASIIVLNAFSNMIEEQNIPFNYFYYTIVDSASAILLHNYYSYVLQKEPFSFELLSIKDNPTAYLLIMCDELLETSVNSIEFNITDDFESFYNIKSSSRGFGFHDKEKMLNELLSLNEIFNKFIINKNVSFNTIFEIKKQEFEDRYVEPSSFLVNKLAHLLHEVINERFGDNEEVRQNRQLDFNQLPPITQRNLFNDAKITHKSLSFLRYEFVDNSDSRKRITELSENELWNLAQIHHEWFLKRNIINGLKYSESYNEEKHTSPEITDWDELDEHLRKHYYKTIKRKFEIVFDINDLKIVRSKLNLLTIEMHNDFCEFTNQNVIFEDLPYNIQESNHHQINKIIKTLSELDYIVVDEEDSRKSINSLNEDEIEFIARSLHETWIKSRLNMGDRFTEKLVEWEKLDDTIKYNNKKSIKHYPQLFQKVGLKIVKEH